MQEITLTHDADELAVIGRHRDAADALLHHQRSDVTYRRLGAHRDDVARHDFMCFHGWPRTSVANWESSAWAALTITEGGGALIQVKIQLQPCVLLPDAVMSEACAHHAHPCQTDLRLSFASQTALLEPEKEIWAGAGPYHAVVPLAVGVSGTVILVRRHRRDQASPTSALCRQGTINFRRARPSGQIYRSIEHRSRGFKGEARHSRVPDDNALRERLLMRFNRIALRQIAKRRCQVRGGLLPFRQWRGRGHSVSCNSRALPSQRTEAVPACSGLYGRPLQTQAFADEVFFIGRAWKLLGTSEP